MVARPAPPAAHAPVAACRLLDTSEAASIVGGSLAQDPTLSGVADSFQVADGSTYLIDDCGYTSSGPQGTTVRMQVSEPQPPHRAQPPDGRQAFQYFQQDLIAHGATLAPLAGLGDAAVAFAPAAGNSALVIVLDGDIVVVAGVDQSTNAPDVAQSLARIGLQRADSGAASGTPGS